MLSVEKPGTPAELVHHGVKGMRWGIRKEARISGKAAETAAKTKARAAGRGRIDAWGAGQRANRAEQQRFIRKAATESLQGPGKLKKLGRFAADVDFELGKRNANISMQIGARARDATKNELPGIKAKHGDYAKLRNRAKNPFSKEAKAYRADVKKAYLKNLEKEANSWKSLSGTRRYTLKDDGEPNTSKYFWKLDTELAHSLVQGTFTVQPIFDDEGYIVDFEIVPTEADLKLTMEFGANFLMHMGLEV